MTQSKSDTFALKKIRFGGYYNQPTPNDDTLLTHVGPATPCGEYLRHYWHPFMLVSELGELPVAVRLLGENLVVFRDQSGQLGLLHRHCAHRGVSLEFGIIEEHGIRCSYHGWHYSVDGTILETPAEPITSPICKNFVQGAYHVREQNGLIFGYMGPPESVPPLPLYDTYSTPGNVPAPFRLEVPCNWLQVVENAADPIHNAFLHAIVSGQQFSPAFKVMPELGFFDTPQGFLSMATRKVGDFVFIRAGDMILPNVSQFPAGTNAAQTELVNVHPTLTRWAVPVDDHNTFYIGTMNLNDFSNPRSRNPEDYGVGKMSFIGQTADRPYTERQAEPGDYDAMVSPGFIVNRKAEHLATTDRGVVKFRRVLANAIQTVRSGEVPLAPRLYPEGVVARTYAHEIVLRLPDTEALSTPQALAEFGRRAAKVLVEMDNHPLEQRDQLAEAGVRKVLQECLAERTVDLAKTVPAGQA
jgi:nitrite reductase/ring-hydroxylating ferredoxin subunit